MYKVEILSDKLEQEAINRRRRLDEERKVRVFNPKLRVMGVDLNALNEQIVIKKEMESIDSKRSEALDRQSRLNDEILSLMDDKVKLARRHQLEEINEYRKTHQQAHQRRDYDLYDPQSLKKDLPARIGDDDPRCGPSTLQQFDGEDLDYGKRDALQKLQMRVWVEEQTYEKERIKQELSAEKQKYDKFQTSINEKMNALQTAVETAKKDQAKYDKEYNAALYAEKKRREEQQRQYEAELNTREIINHVNGVFLTEQPDVFNINGGHKVRVDVFKGFTDEQKKAIRDTQEHQRQEQQAAAALKAKHERDLYLRDLANQRTIELLEREKSRKAKEMAIAIRKENERKAVEDKKRRDFMDRILNNNQPQEEYFNQFNSTSR
ncbi:Protein Tax-1 [Kappamyces sp. JEL0829]